MQKYIKQYEELSHLDGRPVSEVVASLDEGITNLAEEYLDANYKDILVTFTIKDGVAHLSPTFELYSDEGVFMGTYTAHNRLE